MKNIQEVRQITNSSSEAGIVEDRKEVLVDSLYPQWNYGIYEDGDQTLYESYTRGSPQRKTEEISFSLKSTAPVKGV
jgi:hypothetical protein